MENPLLPVDLEIEGLKGMSSYLKCLHLVPINGEFSLNNKGLVFNPGQFAMFGLWGYGESPFGIASSPFETKFINIIVSRIGNVTGAIHRLKKGDKITYRGPYGNGFPIDFFQGKDLILVAGGFGIAPIVSLIEYIIAKRKKFNRVYLLYGVETPNDFLFKDSFDNWRESIEVILTVNKPTADWKGNVMLVSKLTEKIKINPENCAAAICGPQPMEEALENILRPLGISDRRIFVSVDRKMNCAIGKCQHCTTGDKYVCMEGPIFNYDQIQGNWD